MFTQSVSPMLAAWKPIAAILVALAILTPARADEQQKSKPANTPKTTAAEKPNAPKTSADLDKARANVKRLEEEMDNLHRKMFDTAIKLRRAQESVADLGGRQATCEGGAVRAERHMWTHFRHAFHHDGEFWRHFAAHHVRHMEEDGGNSKLEQKVDRLQKQVEQLQRQLQQKK